VAEESNFVGLIIPYMKKHLLLALLLLALLPAAHAQMGLNAPRGLAPIRDMEIYSRDVFLVQQKYIPTTDPISGTYTLSCAVNPPSLTASTGILLDPGGTGNYATRLNCTQTITTSTYLAPIGYELTFNQLDTDAPGDSVIIEDFYGGRIAFSGSALLPVLLVPGNVVRVTFKTDADNNVGAGFALRWRLVNIDPPLTDAGDGRFGKSLQFDLRKGALVGGFNKVGALQRAGDYSTALGKQNTASGDDASALGSYNMAAGRAANALGTFNTASGDYANALGYSSTASGQGATALGYNNTASADFSSALGVDNTASGHASTALGFRTEASGRWSTAIGSHVSTAELTGAMVLGDFSTNVITSATASNQLTGRFVGGYRFFTNRDLTTGVSLAAGGTSWGTISDSTKKERFLPINGPDLLRKIGGMNLTTWNYKGQRDRRHYGPMAQEFFTLFGHDALGDIGCDTLLTTQDVEGLTLSAVQALVRENEQLRTEMASQSARLRLLEQTLLGRRRVTLRKH
jgi:hypothetical protein